MYMYEYKLNTLTHTSYSPVCVCVCMYTYIHVCMRHVYVHVCVCVLTVCTVEAQKSEVVLGGTRALSPPSTRVLKFRQTGVFLSNRCFYHDSHTHRHTTILTRPRNDALSAFIVYAHKTVRIQTRTSSLDAHDVHS